MSEFPDSPIEKNELQKFFSDGSPPIDISNKNSRKPTEFLKQYPSRLNTEGFTVLDDLENLAVGIIQLINLVIDKDIDMIFFLINPRDLLTSFS